MKDELIEIKFNQLQKIFNADYEAIENIEQDWSLKNQNTISKRYFDKGKVLKSIDLSKSRFDYKYIQVYNKLIEFEYKSKPQNLLNFKEYFISEFNKFRREENICDEFELFKNFILYKKKYLQTAQIIITIKRELNIPFSIFAMIDDINGRRIILKKYISQLLDNYNIIYNDQALNLLMSKHELKNGEVIDTIEIFTFDNWFYGDLKNQFSYTSKGNAN